MYREQALEALRWQGCRSRSLWRRSNSKIDDVPVQTYSFRDLPVAEASRPSKMKL
jgi:hypothetical protein